MRARRLKDRLPFGPTAIQPLADILAKGMAEDYIRSKVAELKEREMAKRREASQGGVSETQIEREAEELARSKAPSEMQAIKHVQMKALKRAAELAEAVSLQYSGHGKDGENAKNPPNGKRLTYKWSPPPSELASRLQVQLPDEKSRRVGQSIAAASLPALERMKLVR